MNYTYYYPGGQYGLDANSGNFIGYRLNAGQVGTSLNPSVANQIAEVTNILNQGFKQVEAGALSADLLDQIPKQHFKEINRLTKLTGAKASLHAPIQDIEASGIREGRYDEINREITERRLKDTIDKAYEMNPQVITPVTMHSANMAGSEFVRGEKGEFKESRIIAINRETGQVQNVFKDEERAYPEIIAETGEPLKRSPRDQLNIANSSQWINELQGIATSKKAADEVLGDNLIKLANVLQLEESGQLTESALGPQEKRAIQQLQKSNIFLENVESSFRSTFEKAWKYSNDDTKKELKQIADSWTNSLKGYSKEVQDKYRDKQLTAQIGEIQLKGQLLDQAIQKLDQIKKAPEVFQKVEEFAIDKTADTFSNVALHSYNKYWKKHGKGPVVSIENLYTGMAYSNPADFQKVIETTRDQFVEKAIKQGMSKSEAQSAAKKVIGVTWDVGHLNMLKKQGFKDEDLIKATKDIGKDVKHIHLTDNFGYSDSHLAPGMGNVPIKEHLEQLEKAGALNKDTMLINEIGGVVQQFKVSPLPYMLEAFGSPVTGVMGGPYFNQTQGLTSPYFAGFGTTLPEQHFNLYGSGFSTLPVDLGGQAQGGRSRFSGTPNA